MGTKKKIGELIFNLEWKNKPDNGGDKSNVIGLYDTPSVTSNFEMFKSYLLKNSGVAGNDVKVTYITDDGHEWVIDSQEWFEIALSAFRLKARLEEVIFLKLAKVSSHQMARKHSNDVETQFDVDSMGNSVDTPPEWFVTYMKQFKRDVVEEVTFAVSSNIIANSKDKELQPAPTSSSKKTKPESSKRSRKHMVLGETPIDKEILKTFKFDRKLEIKLDKLDAKTKKINQKKQALIGKIDSDEQRQSGKFSYCPIDEFELISKCLDDETAKKDSIKVKKDLASEVPPETDGTGFMNGCLVNAVNTGTHEQMMGGEVYLHTWDVMNSGKLPWTANTQLRMTWGSAYMIPSVKTLRCPPLKPGEKGSISVRFEIPKTPGTYESHWNFFDKNIRFGQSLSCSVVVQEPLSPIPLHEPLKKPNVGQRQKLLERVLFYQTELTKQPMNIPVPKFAERLLYFPKGVKEGSQPLDIHIPKDTDSVLCYPGGEGSKPFIIPTGAVMKFPHGFQNPESRVLFFPEGVVSPSEDPNAHKDTQDNGNAKEQTAEPRPVHYFKGPTFREFPKTEVPFLGKKGHFKGSPFLDVTYREFPNGTYNRENIKPKVPLQGKDHLKGSPFLDVTYREFPNGTYNRENIKPKVPLQGKDHLKGSPFLNVTYREFPNGTYNRENTKTEVPLLGRGHYKGPTLPNVTYRPFPNMTYNRENIKTEVPFQGQNHYKGPFLNVTYREFPNVTSNRENTKTEVPLQGEDLRGASTAEDMNIVEEPALNKRDELKIEGACSSAVIDLSRRIKDIKISGSPNADSDSEWESVWSYGKMNLEENLAMDCGQQQTNKYGISETDLLVGKLDENLTLDGEPKSNKYGINEKDLIVDLSKNAKQVKPEEVEATKEEDAEKEDVGGKASSVKDEDDNNNNGTADNNNSSGESISEIASEASDLSSGYDVLNVPVCDEKEDSSGYVYITIDGNKLPVPKHILRPDFLLNAEEAPGPLSFDDDEKPADAEVPSNENHPDEASTLVNLEASGDEAQDPKSFLSHCSTAGTCFSDMTSGRLFIFPQNNPGYEVICPEKPKTGPNSQDGNEPVLKDETGTAPTTLSWPNSDSQYTFADIPNPSHLRTDPYGPLEHSQPPLCCSPRNGFYGGYHHPGSPMQSGCDRVTPTEHPMMHRQWEGYQHVPNYQQSVPKPCGLPTGNKQEVPSAPPQQCKSPDHSTVPNTPVHILPENLVSGAVNVASSAINTARSVINMIVPPKVEPGKWVNGHWVTENPQSLRAKNLCILAEMGFWNADLNASLLARYNDDIARVVSELVQ